MIFASFHQGKEESINCLSPFHTANNYPLHWRNLLLLLLTRPVVSLPHVRENPVAFVQVSLPVTPADGIVFPVTDRVEADAYAVRSLLAAPAGFDVAPQLARALDPGLPPARFPLAVPFERIAPRRPESYHKHNNRRSECSTHIPFHVFPSQALEKRRARGAPRGGPSLPAINLQNE